MRVKAWTRKCVIKRTMRTNKKFNRSFHRDRHREFKYSITSSLTQTHGSLWKEMQDAQPIYLEHYYYYYYNYITIYPFIENLLFSHSQKKKRKIRAIVPLSHQQETIIRNYLLKRIVLHHLLGVVNSDMILFTKVLTFLLTTNKSQLTWRILLIWLFWLAGTTGP